ncbi:MAG: class I SAM-dependent methyltransferase [Opitutales bacterium]
MTVPAPRGDAALTSATAWYDSPLYYDMVYADYTPAETRFITGICRRHAGTGSRPLRVLEPACGSGRLLESLSRRGHVVHGFDLNRNQVAFARARLRRKGLKGKVWIDSMDRFRLPAGRPYDVAHCFVSTFKYLTSEAAAKRALRLMAAAVRPGGLVLLGLHLTDYRDRREGYERWIGRRGGLKVISHTWSFLPDRRRRVEGMKTRMKIVRGGDVRVEDTVWDFRTYSPTELRRLIAQAPDLELVACHDFHYDLGSTRSIDLSYSDIVVVLRRREPTAGRRQR